MDFISPKLTETNLNYVETAEWMRKKAAQLLSIRISDIVPKDQIWLTCPVTNKLLAVVKDVNFENDQNAELKHAAKDIDCGR